MINCPIKERLENTIKDKIKGNASTYVIKGNNVFIPIGKTISSKEATYKVAKDKVDELNYIYDSENFGESVSLDNSKTDGTGINIHPTEKLIEHYTKLEKIKEYNDLLENNLDYKLDYEALQSQNSNEFYNVNELDLTRKNQNYQLNKLIKNTISNVINTTTGQKVVIQRIEDYKKNNPSIDMLGVANLLDGILAYTIDDGITLAEEGWHFLTYILWNDPMFDNIKANMDELYDSKTWQDNYDKYLSLYNGDVAKVEMEIVGKLLAQYSYDKLQNEKLGSKIKYYFKSLLAAILKPFRIKINNTPNFYNNYSKQLRDLLDPLYQELVSERLQNRAAAGNLIYDASGTSVPNYTKLSKENQLLQKAIVNTKNQIKKIKTSQSELKGYLLQRYNDLKVKYAPIGLNNRIDITNYLKTLTNKNTTTYKELVELYKLMMSYNNEYSKNAAIDRLSDRLDELTEDYKTQLFATGISHFFFGNTASDYLDPIRTYDTAGNLVNIDPGTEQLDKNGALSELKRYIDLIEQINNGTYVLDIEVYHRIREGVRTYIEIFKTIDLFYANNSKLFGGAGDKGFTDLSIEQNDKLKKGVKLGLEHIQNIERFLLENKIKVYKDFLSKEENISPRLKNEAGDIILNDDYLFGEINMFFRAAGQQQHAKEDVIKILQRKLMLLDLEISKNTTNYATNLYSTLKDKLNRNKRNMKLLFETNDKGQPVNYILSSKLTHKFVEAEETFKKDIITELKNYVVLFGGNKQEIPNNYDDLENYFSGINLESSNQTFISDETNKRIQLKEYMYELWGNWYISNTKPLRNAQYIIQLRQQQLTPSQFKKWSKGNFKILENGNYVYFGELVEPNSNYDNPKYNTLKTSNPELFSILETLTLSLQTSKAELNRGIYSYAYNHLLPQISKSTMDVVSNFDLKGLGERFKETFTYRPDDDLYAERFDGEIVKQPPIRFDKLIEPSQITNDLFRSIVMYNNMKENYIKKSQSLLEIQGLIDIVSDSKVQVTNFNKNKEIQGTDSNLLKGMEYLVNKIIYGEKVDKLVLSNSVDISKISKTLYTWQRNVGLQGNTASAVTGRVSAWFDNIVDIIVGKYGTKEDYIKATKIYTSDLPIILSDFESPIKTSKISIIANEVGLVDDVISRFSDLDKGRLLRGAEQTVNYGLWRALDVDLKYKVAITTALQIKKYNDEYITYTNYKNRKITDDWNKLPTLWDDIKILNNKVDWGNIPNEVVELYKTRSINISHNLDTTASEYDKGELQSHAIGRFFTMFMNYFFQLLARGFKNESYNYLTNEMEQGYAQMRILKQVINPITWYNVIKNKEGIEDIDKESLLRLSAYMISTTIAMTLAYLLAAAALDDDEEDDSSLQFASYVAMRVLQEQSSRLSIKETINYISRPGESIDKLSGIFAPFDLIARFVDTSGDDSKIVQSGIYKGWDKRDQLVIKNLPLIRGLFEGIGGGLINESLGKPSIYAGIAYSGKSKYIKSKVINDNTFTSYLLNAPFAYVPRTMGGMFGYGITSGFYNNYKTDAMLWSGLPTKKANLKKK